jgi:hypothetical protein
LGLLRPPPGEGLALFPCRRAHERPAPPDGGEVPRAATGRSPGVRASWISTRNGTSGSGHCRIGPDLWRYAMGNCAGIDWASEKHDVLIADAWRRLDRANRRRPATALPREGKSRRRRCLQRSCKRSGRSGSERGPAVAVARDEDHSSRRARDRCIPAMMRESVQLGVGAEAAAVLLREAKHQRPRERRSACSGSRPAAVSKRRCRRMTRGGYRPEQQSDPAASRCRNRESRRRPAGHRTSATPRPQLSRRGRRTAASARRCTSRAARGRRHPPRYCFSAAIGRPPARSDRPASADRVIGLRGKRSRAR